MNIKKAKEEIKNTVEAYLFKNSRGEYMLPAMRQRPVLLMGPPGIGKTQIMEQAARECGIGLVSYTITHHTRQSAIGLPFIMEKNYGGEKRSVTEYTMSEIVASIYDRMEETGLSEGILFIDEINCVSETLAPAMLQFLQYKTFGNHKIPEGWIVTAAGNPPEYNKSVREFDIATLDRVKRIDVEADFEVWKEYAKEVRIHPAVVSYLTAKPGNFYQIETTVDGKRFATPRGWEDLARFLEVYEQLHKTVDRDVVSQFIQHAGIAKDFANYLELYYKYQDQYQIDQALSGKRDGRLMEKAARAPFDERLSVVSLILSKLNVSFREAMREEDLLELLFSSLKAFKERSGTADGVSELGQVFEEFSEETERKKRAGLLSREEEYLRRDAQDRMNRYLLTVREESLREPDAVLFRVRELFGEEKARLEKLCGQALQKLEYAFDFMEGTFGDSQEMVIFVTELNSGYDSVRFLRENECERYYEYNKRLLFSDREEELKKQLSRFGRF